MSLNNKSKIYKKNAYNISCFDLSNDKFDLIFLDPPFKDNRINLLISEIKKSKISNKKTVIVIHRNKKNLEKFSNELIILREKNYGLSKIIFGKII